MIQLAAATTDEIMRRRPRAPTDRNDLAALVNEVGVLDGPLVRLLRAHAEAEHGVDVRDAEALDKDTLRTDVVIVLDPRERALRAVGGRRRLAVAEERGNDDEVLLRVERFVSANRPEAVRHYSRVPGRVYDGGLIWRSERRVGDVSILKDFARFELEVAEFERLQVVRAMINLTQRRHRESKESR